MVFAQRACLSYWRITPRVSLSGLCCPLLCVTWWQNPAFKVISLRNILHSFLSSSFMHLGVFCCCFCVLLCCLFVFVVYVFLFFVRVSFVCLCWQQLSPCRTTPVFVSCSQLTTSRWPWGQGADCVWEIKVYNNLLSCFTCSSAQAAAKDTCRLPLSWFTRRQVAA